MFEFLKLKVYINGNSLIVRKGIGRVKPAKAMTWEEYCGKIKECMRAGLSPYVAAASMWNLPDGVTELKTNISFLRSFDNANRPALSLWYVAKYEGKLYYELTDRLQAVGCSQE